MVEFLRRSGFFLVSNVCRPPTGSWSSFCGEVDFSRTSAMCVDPLLGHGRVSAEKWVFSS